MLRYIFLFGLMAFCKSGKERTHPPPKAETVLFRTSEHNLVFRLTIDNCFTYYDSLLNQDIVMGYSIGSYKKQNDSSLINLKINEKDTTFKYPLYKADSILFGLTGSRHFYIITNHDRNAWIID
jgi:hypothetical protein